MKKKSAFTFKELLFAYLAISKLFYWMNNIGSLAQDDWSAVLNFIVDRLLMQDIMTIWILVAMFLLEHYADKYFGDNKTLVKNLVIFGIGYVIYTVSIVLYSIVIHAIFAEYMITVSEIISFLLDMTLFYAIACAVLQIKDRLKKKEAEHYVAREKACEDTADLLATLQERGVLTLEEVQEKLAKLS